MNLPPLPEPIWGYSTNTPKFSAEQMQEYARAAIAALSAQPAAHRITRWAYCAICQHDCIPGEGCARPDCPDAQPAPAQAQQPPDPVYIASDGTFYPIPRRRQPLTDEQIVRCILMVDDPLLWGRMGDECGVALEQFARAIEAAHGIKE